MQLGISDKRSGSSNPPLYFGIIGQNADGEYGYVSKSTGRFVVAPPQSPDGGYAATVDFMPASFASSVSLESPLLSARCYLSLGQGLSMPIGTDGYRGPNFASTSDPNYKIVFDKIEFTLNAGLINCNTTCVDFFGLPLTIALSGADTAGPVGIASPRSTVFALFDDSPWSGLVQPGLRVLNPGKLAASPGWLDDYISLVWDRGYSQEAPLKLTINGQKTSGYPDTSGTYRFTIGGETHSIARPGALDIFSCAGVFTASGKSIADDGALKSQIAAALNRGVFNHPFDEWLNGDNFYKANPALPARVASYNKYAARLHGSSLHGLCYGFADDDIGNFSSDISGKDSDTLTITLY